MYSNRVITDPKAIPDSFNNYFVYIGPTLASKIPNNNISHRWFLPKNLRKLKFFTISRTHRWNRDKEYN